MTVERADLPHEQKNSLPRAPTVNECGPLATRTARNHIALSTGFRTPKGRGVGPLGRMVAPAGRLDRLAGLGMCIPNLGLFPTESRRSSIRSAAALNRK